MQRKIGRLKFASPFVLFLALLLLLSGCGASRTERESAPKVTKAVQEESVAEASGETRSAATPAKTAIRTLEATVTSVSDGDTVHVSLNGRDERVRMIGANCPEISHPDLGIREQPYGKKAKAYTERQLSGRKVWLEFDVQQRDKYGRLLAYVWPKPPPRAPRKRSGKTCSTPGCSLRATPRS